MDQGYSFSRPDFATLLLRKFYPERTAGESLVIREFLQRHLDDYDRINFSVRLGDGLAPDPSHLPAIQQQTVRNTQKRIDILAWRGSQPAIIEVKQRVTPATLGQILTYRHLFLEENPDAPEPELVVVGKTSDDDTIRVLAAHGIQVYLYEETNAGAVDTARPV